jgi:ribonuclease P protein component
MLPKKERLTTRDIALLEKGRSVFGTALSIRYIPTAAESSVKKFSVSVSKKVAKLAVSRNRIRRRVYAALRDAGGKVKRPVYVMVMPKKECSFIPLDEIRRELGSLFEKAGLTV